MIDHIGLHVHNVARATEFYLKALAPLGIVIVMQVSAEETGGSAHVGFGAGQKAFFWIGENEEPSGLLHIAFAAGRRAAVDAFYHAALRAGGTDNGRPRLRPEYHANYYGAFVLDLDGNNVEAVCHLPERTAVRLIAARNSGARRRRALAASHIPFPRSWGPSSPYRG